MLEALGNPLDEHDDVIGLGATVGVQARGVPGVGQVTLKL